MRGAGFLVITREPAIKAAATNKENSGPALAIRPADSGKSQRNSFICPFLSEIFYNKLSKTFEKAQSPQAIFNDQNEWRKGMKHGMDSVFPHLSRDHLGHASLSEKDDPGHRCAF